MLLAWLSGIQGGVRERDDERDLQRERDDEEGRRGDGRERDDKGGAGISMMLLPPDVTQHVISPMLDPASRYLMSRTNKALLEELPEKLNLGLAIESKEVVVRHVSNIMGNLSKGLAMHGQTLAVIVNQYQRPLDRDQRHPYHRPLGGPDRWYLAVFDISGPKARHFHTMKFNYSKSIEIECVAVHGNIVAAGEFRGYVSSWSILRNKGGRRSVVSDIDSQPVGDPSGYDPDDFIGDPSTVTMSNGDIVTFPIGYPVEVIASNGELVAAVNFEGTLTVWNKHHVLARVVEWADRNLEELVFVERRLGPVLLTASREGTITSWSPVVDMPPLPFALPAARRLAGDGAMLAILESGGWLSLFDLSKEVLVKRFEVELPPGTSDADLRMQIEISGRFVATNSPEGLQVWDGPTGTSLLKIPGTFSTMKISSVGRGATIAIAALTGDPLFPLVGAKDLVLWKLRPANATLIEEALLKRRGDDKLRKARARAASARSPPPYRTGPPP